MPIFSSIQCNLVTICPVIASWFCCWKSKIKINFQFFLYTLDELDAFSLLQLISRLHLFRLLVAFVKWLFSFHKNRNLLISKLKGVEQKFCRVTFGQFILSILLEKVERNCNFYFFWFLKKCRRENISLEIKYYFPTSNEKTIN